MKKFLIILALFCLAPAAQAATIGSVQTNNIGLVGYWTLDGAHTNWGTGQTSDRSGSGYTGTLGLMPTSSSPVSGVVGQGFKFSGSNYVLSSGFTWPSGSAVTVAFWTKFPPCPGPSNCGFFGSNNGSGERFAISWIPGNNNLYWDYGDLGGGARAVADISAHYGQWVHVIATASANEHRIYINGKVAGSGTPNPPTQSFSQFQIGAWIDGSAFAAPGTVIDDMRVYNRALTDVEASGLYASGGSRLGASGGTNSPLRSGLLAHWTFDGANTNWSTNTFADLSGQGNTATPTGMATSTAPVPGKIGQALQWDGGTDYVRSTSLINTAVVTVSAWVYLKALPSDCSVVASFADSSVNPTLFDKRITVDSSGFAQFYVYDGSSISTPAAGAALTLNAWHLLTGTADGTHAKMYVDGVLVSSIAAGSTFTGYSSPNVYVGPRGACAAYPAAGMRIDDVRIYGKALTADEVRGLYGAGGTTVGQSATPFNSPLSSGLVGHWTFDGSKTNWNTNKVTDSSSQGNTGTLVSMSTTTSPVIGKIGQALQFNGSSYIDAGNPASLQITSNLTVSVWVKPAAQPVGSDIGFQLVAKDKESGGRAFVLDYNNYSTGCSSNSCLRFYINGGAGSSLVTSGASIGLTTSEWAHVVGTYSSTGILTLYKNGVQVGRTTGAATSIPSATANVNIGRREYADFHEHFVGALDDVRIYNRTLDSEEVKVLYQMGR